MKKKIFFGLLITGGITYLVAMGVLLLFIFEVINMVANNVSGVTEAALVFPVGLIIGLTMFNAVIFDEGRRVYNSL